MKKLLVAALIVPVALLGAVRPAKASDKAAAVLTGVAVGIGAALILDALAPRPVVAAPVVYAPPPPPVVYQPAPVIVTPRRWSTPRRQSSTRRRRSFTLRHRSCTDPRRLSSTRLVTSSTRPRGRSIIAPVTVRRTGRTSTATAMATATAATTAKTSGIACGGDPSRRAATSRPPSGDRRQQDAAMGAPTV